MCLFLATCRFAFWWQQQVDIQSCIHPVEVRLLVKAEQILRQSQDTTVVAARVLQGPLLGCTPSTNTLLRLTYVGEPLREDTRASIVARLKPVVGTHNPGLFLYQQWAWAQGFLAAGYIRELKIAEDFQSPTRQCSSCPHTLLYPGLLSALSQGERSGVERHIWQLLRETGTVHLMVISGLHVGIYAGLCGLVVLWLLRVAVSMGMLNDASLQQLSLRKLSFTAAILGAWLVLLVTGLQASVLRATLMTSFGILLFLLGRGLAQRLYMWTYTAIVVVLFAPQYLLLSGYWLSFGAVLVIILFVPLIQASRHRWYKAALFCRAQFILFVGMAPWVAYSSGFVTLLAPAANLLVVPVVTTTTMPLLVIAQGLDLAFDASSWACAFWRLADFSMWSVIQILSTLQQSQPQAIVPLGYFSPIKLVQLTAIALLLLVPGLVRPRLCASVLALCVVLSGREQAVHPGHFRIHVFDVGQGSAAMVTTAGQRLLIDAGPASALPDQAGFDAGAAIVYPAVMRLGAPEVKRLVLTHSDLDHAGGLAALQARFPGMQVVADADCSRAADWQVDGVSFSLHRVSDAPNENDRSCTVVVRGVNTSAYFGGDISMRSERILLPHLPRKIDFLVSPHHGSNSSSSWNFVAHVRPQVVVHSAGAHNRYGHPHLGVLGRYAAAGGINLVTAQTGAVILDSRFPGIAHSSRLGLLRLDE